MSIFGLLLLFTLRHATRFVDYIDYIIGHFRTDGPTPGVLYEVDVPIMSNPECHDMFKKAGHEKRILDSFLCAGYSEGKKDSCEVYGLRSQKS